MEKKNIPNWLLIVAFLLSKIFCGAPFGCRETNKLQNVCTQSINTENVKHLSDGSALASRQTAIVCPDQIDASRKRFRSTCEFSRHNFHQLPSSIVIIIYNSYRLSFTNFNYCIRLHIYSSQFWWMQLRFGMPFAKTEIELNRDKIIKILPVDVVRLCVLLFRKHGSQRMTVATNTPAKRRREKKTISSYCLARCSHHLTNATSRFEISSDDRLFRLVSPSFRCGFYIYIVLADGCQRLQTSTAAQPN